MRPTQRIFIVEENTRYAFDAVIKLDMETSLKVAEEEGDVKKGDPVNYAITQPDKLEMEVSISDTVTVNGEPLTEGSGSRAMLAYKCLRAMQKRRNLLTVITPFDNFTNMMIETFTCEMAEEYQNEMHAQIAFKQMTVQAKAKKKSSTPPKNDKDPETKSDLSVLFTFLNPTGGKTTPDNGSSATATTKPVTPKARTISIN